MRQALSITWRTLALGLAVSAITAGASYLAEQRSLRLTGAALTQAAIARAVSQFQQEADNAEVLAQVLDQPNVTVDDAQRSMSKLGGRKPQKLSGTNWLWVRKYEAGAASEATTELTVLLGSPTRVEEGGSSSLFALVHASGDIKGLPPGSNLGREAWFTAALSDTSPSSHFRIIRAGETRLWPSGAVVITAPSPTARDLVLRIVPSEDLSAVGLSVQDRKLTLFDAQKPQDFVGMSPDEADALRLPVVPGSNVWLSISPLPIKPTAWVAVLLLGVLATIMAWLYRVALLLGNRSSDALAELAGTRTELADARAFETAFFESSGTANCVIDAETQRFRRVNERLCALLKYQPEELLGMTFMDVTYPGDLAQSLDISGKMSAQSPSVAQFEKRYVSKDGEVIWCLVNTRPFVLGSDKRTYFASSILDITNLKKIERTRNNLVMELAHRVRNTVQLAASLARHSARSAKTVADYNEVFQQRLAALIAAQDVLFDADWSDVLLADVAQKSLAPFLRLKGANLTVDLPRLRLNAQQAQTMAIALHELALNSLKHGVLSTRGTAQLSGSVSRTPNGAGAVLSLLWEEKSEVTRKAAKVAREGFGTQTLLKVLPAQFGGSAAYEWKKDGLVYRATLPMSAGEHPPPHT